MNTIAVIGGGFSGTMCAVHLIEAAQAPLKIIINEKNELARGVAYSNGEPSYLLNVRADQMGAFPEHVSHFYEWLKAHGMDAAPSDFISRKIYGDYLEELLASSLKKSQFADIQVIRDEAIDLNLDTREIFFANGSKIHADKVILATGLDVAVKFDVNSLSSSTDPVTILGSGLSMVDAIVHLQKINHKGPITVVSRRGRIPESHKFYPPEEARPKYSFENEYSLRHVFKTVKNDLKKYEWRLVIDALRPHNQKLWIRWSVKEKGQFLRYLRNKWDVSRHRMSPAHKEMIEGLVSQGKLEIIAAGFKQYVPGISTVIDCRGYSFGQAPSNKLIGSLLNKKLIQSDKFNLGIHTTSQGEVVGVAKGWLYAIGPLRRGDLWECTAVPEIRSQAKLLAYDVISAL